MDYYVDQGHNSADDENSGAEDAPFLNIQAAIDAAEPGDVIYVKSGTYDSVRIENSGTEEAPITLMVHPDHAGQVVIDGGGAQVNKAFGAIHMEKASHIIIDGFEVTNSHFGISARSDGVTEYSDIQIINNYIHDVDNSGIWVAGQPMHLDTEVDNFIVSDILISNNQVTKTNLGEVSGGANEAITIAGGVDGFEVTQNWIYESNQYGIDAKTNVMNGIISENIIHDIEKYGVYIDSNSRTASTIEISDNIIFNVSSGIVLSREAADGLKSDIETGYGESIDDFEEGGYKPVLTEITIIGNVIAFSEKSGIYVDKHHTKDLGGGEFGNILIEGNTVSDSGYTGVMIDPNLEGTITNLTIENNSISGSGRREINSDGHEEILIINNNFDDIDINSVIATKLYQLDSFSSETTETVLEILDPGSSDDEILLLAGASLVAVQDDSFSVSAEALAEAGSSWFRLAAVNDGTTLLANDADSFVIKDLNLGSLGDGTWFDGSNGGQFRVFESGVVDFRNQGDTLASGETTSFKYVASDGTESHTATVSLTVDAMGLAVTSPWDDEASMSSSAEPLPLAEDSPWYDTAGNYDFF